MCAMAVIGFFGLYVATFVLLSPALARSGSIS